MDPLNAAYLVFMVIIGALRGFYQRRFGGQTPARRDESVLDRVLLLTAMAAMMPIPLLHLASDVFGAADADFPSWLSWSGVAFLAAGAWLFWRSHADLGANWSARIAIQERHTLIENGLYRRIRHPMYTSLLVSGVGQLLVLRNWIAGPSLLAAALLFYFFRIPREEAMLTAQFGDAYRAYMGRTGKVWPRF